MPLILSQAGSSGIGLVNRIAGFRAGDSAPPLILDRETFADFLCFYEPALECCQDAFLALFTLPDKRTLFTRNISEILDRATCCVKRALHVYLHIHLHTRPEGGGKRGCKETTRVAIGLFGDIDAQGPRRNKPSETLCPSVRDAIGITVEFNTRMAPLRIAFLVGSGYGCYPILLFKEPLVIRTPGDRQLLESLGQRFHSALQQIACEQGWNGAVDRCDLAKVLRPPGTLNFKDPANPQMVHIVEKNEFRFTLMDLDELLPPLKIESRKVSSGGTQRITGDAGFILASEAIPPKEMFELTMELDPRFALSWDHRRPDLTDQTQSGYDMSLAALAADLGWKDQEIVDLLISNRRRFNADLKRPDYYQRTLAKARACAGRRESNG
jgi:hypothetical protein